MVFHGGSDLGLEIHQIPGDASTGGGVYGLFSLSDQFVVLLKEGFGLVGIAHTVYDNGNGRDSSAIARF